MRRYVILSLIFHLMIMVVIVLDLPFFEREKLPDPVKIGVEIVTHLPEKKTEMPEPDPVEEQAPEQLAEAPAPPPAPTETVLGAKEDLPTPEKVEKEKPIPQEAVEKIPDVLPQPKPVKKPEPKPEPVEAAKPKAASVKPITKPKPTPVKDDFDELADALLSEDKEPMAKKKAGKGGGEKAPKGLEAGDRERISKQLQPCWVMQEVADVNVEINVKMGPDGRFAQPKLVDNFFGGSTIHRSIAEAAQRAVLDQRCNDFSWLREKFQDLTSLTLIFNPRDMVGW